MNVVDDDKMIVTSNCTTNSSPTTLAKMIVRQNLAAAARHLFGAPLPQYLNAITIATLQAIADTGATSFFCNGRHTHPEPAASNTPTDNKFVRWQQGQINTHV
jgi:predicted RNA binding protein with dsRBD fold (UPF0201 family)